MYCERRIEREKESERERMRERGREREKEREREREREGGKQCYFSLGVVMETAASLQMETSRTHGSSNKWRA